MCVCSGNEILDFSASGIPQFPSRLLLLRQEEERNDKRGTAVGRGGLVKRNICLAGGQAVSYMCIYIYSNESVCVPLLPFTLCHLPCHRFKSTVAYIINVPPPPDLILSRSLPAVTLPSPSFCLFLPPSESFLSFISLFPLLYPAGSMCAF